tara:strand:- start:808 stop:5586 length:4779 start_codon:yes stop_codon:yes gene_type:complete
MAELFSEDIELDLLNVKRQPQNITSVTPEQARQLSIINQMSSSIPPSVMVNAAEKNVDMGMIDLLSEFFGKAKEASYGKVKKAIFNQFNVNPDTGGLFELGLKGTFMGVRALYEDVIARPFRTAELVSQGMEFENAWEKAGIDPFTYWREASESGQKIDLGTALFQSTNPEKTEIYKELIDSGADPIKAREIAAAQLGVNIFDKIFEAEKNVQFDGERAAALIARGKSPHATPGRVFFKPFEFIVGPEDKAYDFYTGIIDLGLNFLDPTFWAGKAVKTARAGSKMLTLTDAGMDTLGLFKNGWVRKTFSRRSAQEFIDSKAGDEIWLFLFNNRDKPVDILTKSNFKLVNRYVTENKAISDEFTKFIDDLSKLDSKNLKSNAEKIDAVKKIISPRILTVATEGTVPTLQKQSIWRNSLRTYFGPNYGSNLTATNADNLIVEYSKFLRTLDPNDQLIDANKRVLDLMTELNKLDVSNPLLRGSIIATRVADDFDSFKVIYKEGLEKSKGKELSKADAQFIEDTFTVFKKVIKGNADDVSKNKADYSRLKRLSPAVEKRWKQLMKKRENRTLGLTDEQIDDAFDEISKQPLLETTLTQELFLPKPSETIKLVNKLDRSMKGKYLQALNIIGEGPMGNVLDFYVSSLFKPLALLRPAWTVRVIAEEQIRAIANGALGTLDHPMGLLARLSDDTFAGTRLGRRPSYAKTGFTGSTKWKMGIAEAESGDTRTLKALRRKAVPNELTKRQAKKYIKAELSDWKDGQWSTLNNWMNSVIAKRIAAIELGKEGPKKAAYKKLNKEIRLGLKDEQSQIFAAVKALDQSSSANPLSLLSGKGITRTEYIKVVDDYLAEIVKEMRRNFTKDGKASSMSRDLLELIETGAFKNAKGETINIDKISKGGLSDADIKLFNDNKLDRKSNKRIQKEMEVNTKKGTDEYIDNFGELLPDEVDYIVDPLTTNKAFLDRQVENLFKWFMTIPTNEASRIPVYKSTYWNTAIDLIPISSRKVRDKIRKGAVDNKLDKKTINRIDKLDKKYPIKEGEDLIDDAQLIEAMAKGKAVNTVKDLLYDITETRRFWEVTRWAFPFGNAYQEVLTTWAKILKQNPNVIARSQTVWDGASQDNDALGPEGSGFFYENPINKQVVFNYPGTGIVQDWMFRDAAPGTDVRVNMPVYAQSVNIAASLLPGFGPVVRIPAALMFNNFPEESFITRFVFGDFPPPNMKDKSDIIKALGFKPAWLDKFDQVIFNAGENSQGVYGNTVMDVYKALLYSGQIDDSTEEGMKEGLDKALENSKQIFLIRGITQFIGPAGATSPIFQITDKNANIFFIETLADEYRKIKESSNYDDAVATQRFVETYGLNPLPLTVAKTVTLEKYPTTVEGADWMKENKELYDQYPLVAWYLEPPPSYAEFSFDSYKKSLFENAREYRTPEQWAVAKNKLLGAIALRTYEQEIGIVGNNSEAARNLRNAKKKELEQRYWGYGQPGVVGSPTQPSIGMQIDQLEKMIQDPSLQNNSVVISAQKYFALRQQIIDGFVTAGLSETVWKTSSKYVALRGALRNEAFKLVQENPKFGPLFDQLLARELEPEYEDDFLLQLGENI